MRFLLVIVFLNWMFTPDQRVNAAPLSNQLIIDEYSIARGGVPRDPFVAPDGSVWFCGQSGNYLGQLNPKTGFVRYVELRDGTHPHNLVVDKMGHVWYAGNRNAHIGVVDPLSGSIVEVPMPSTVSDPHTLVFDAEENIWFTAQHSNVIGFLNTRNRKVQVLPIPTLRSRPYGIKMSTNGHVWSVLLGTNKLVHVDSKTFTLREIELPHADARPRRLEITADGRVWYADYARDTLGMYDPAQRNFNEWQTPGGIKSKPYATVLDHAERIWLSETGFSPSRLVGFDTKALRFISAGRPKTDGTIRHMYFDTKEKHFWFGIDGGVIAVAKPH